MTDRDEFAKAAMTVILSSVYVGQEISEEVLKSVAKSAFDMADMMMYTGTCAVEPGSFGWR